MTKLKLDMSSILSVEDLQDFLDECRKEQVTHLMAWVNLDSLGNVHSVYMEPWE